MHQILVHAGSIPANISISGKRGTQSYKKSSDQHNGQKIRMPELDMQQPQGKQTTGTSSRRHPMHLRRLPLFFSLVELETLLGYKGGNNDVKMALKRMAKEDMLILDEDDCHQEKYYLGKMARAILDRRTIPDILHHSTPLYCFGNEMVDY